MNGQTNPYLISNSIIIMPTSASAASPMTRAAVCGYGMADTQLGARQLLCRRSTPLRRRLINGSAANTLLLLSLLAGLLLLVSSAVGAEAAAVEPLDCTIAYRCGGGHEAALVTWNIPPGPYIEDAATDLEASLAALAAASPLHANYSIAPAVPGGSAMGTLRVVADGCAFDGGLTINLPSTAPPLTGGADDRPVISIEVANIIADGVCPAGVGVFTISAPNPTASLGYNISVAVHNATISAVCSMYASAYAVLLNGLQLSGGTIRIDHSTLNGTSIGGAAMGLAMSSCVVTDSSRIDLCETNAYASLERDGSAAAVALLASSFDGGSAMTIGGADMSASALKRCCSVCWSFHAVRQCHRDPRGLLDSYQPLFD